MLPARDEVEEAARTVLLLPNLRALQPAFDQVNTWLTAFHAAWMEDNDKDGHLHAAQVAIIGLRMNLERQQPLTMDFLETWFSRREGSARAEDAAREVITIPSSESEHSDIPKAQQPKTRRRRKKTAADLPFDVKRYLGDYAGGSGSSSTAQSLAHGTMRRSGRSPRVLSWQ
ncbi:hypothetical protein JCM10207_001354 [Rhodosporidiobolus poonsookiae]